MFLVGNGKDMGGVGILFAENWVEELFDVKGVSDRIMFIKFVVRKSIAHGPKLVLLRSYLVVVISMVTLERMLMGMWEFMVVEDLEDIICRE